MFPKLMFLSLNELPRLMSFCDTDNRVEMLQLVRLKICGLYNITAIYPTGDASWQPYALFTKQVHIPKLESLSIKKMEKLKQIWPCETATTNKHEKEVTNISMLRVIDVRRCDSIVNLFPCNPLPLLNHLKRLEVRDCGSIQVLFNIDLGGAANMYTQPTSSLDFILVSRLKTLKEIWRIKGTANDNDSSSSALCIRAFESVKRIRIHSCMRFRDVFTPKDSNFEMRAKVKIT